MSDSAPANAATRWFTPGTQRFDVIVATITLALSFLLISNSPEGFDTGWPEVAAGVGAFVLILFRRRWPIPILAVAFIETVVHVLVLERPTPMVFATLVLVTTVAARLDRRPAIGLGVIVGGGLYSMSLFVTDSAFGDGRNVIALVWTALAVGVGDANRSWRRYRESVDAQLHSAVAAAEADARRQVTEERLSIARELHDLLAHNLAVMNVQTGAALHLLRADPDGAEGALTVARDAGRSVLDELRELLAVLRSEDTDGDAPTSSLPTVADVPKLIETVRASGLEVTWTESGTSRPLTPAASLAAYRIIQEGLTNAAKHGDGRAEVSQTWADAGLAIAISNRSSAEPADATSGGHGLVGMRERVVGNGGTFEAGPDDGRFVVRAV